jgi:hypothetical protein
MRLQHRCLLTSGFTMLSVVAAFGGASAASSTERSAITPHRHHAVQVVPQPRFYSSYNNYNLMPVTSEDCYLPSDGCPNEDSVQN